MPTQSNPDSPGFGQNFDPEHWKERQTRMTEQGSSGDVFRGTELRSLVTAALARNEGESVSAERYLNLLTTFVEFSIRHGGPAVPMAAEHIDEAMRIACSPTTLQAEPHFLHIVAVTAEPLVQPAIEDIDSVA